MSETEVGVVKHFFDKISVAAIELTGPLAEGDNIHIKGAHTDMNCVVANMQIEHAIIKSANKGDSIGMKVPGKAREHDKVFKATP